MWIGVEILAAVTAAAGLLALGWMLLGRLFLPAGAADTVLAVVRATGDAQTLEQDVRSLLWLKRSGMAGFTVVVADCGLTDRGRALAGLLEQREGELLFCPENQLGELLREKTAAR